MSDKTPILLKTCNGTQVLRVKSVKDIRDYLKYECNLLVNGKFIGKESIPLQDYADVHVLIPLKGGKGGFGSNLKAQGGRMNRKGENETEDECRDLQGRRLKTIKAQKQVSEFLEKEPERKRQKLQELEDKIDRLKQAQEPKKLLFDDKEFMQNHDKITNSIKSTLKEALNKQKPAKTFMKWDSSSEDED